MKYGDGIFKVAAAGDVEEHTANGWTLVDVIATTGEVGSHRTLCAAPTYVGGPLEQQNVYNPVYGAVTHYLLRKDPESEMAKLRAQLAAAQDAVKTSAAEAKMARDAEAQLRSDLEDWKRDYHSVLGHRTAAEVKARKMEIDLGKLRAELGEGEMRRILGETKS